MQNISPYAGMPAAKKQGISPVLRSQLVLIILPLVLALLIGAGIGALQATSERGLELGSPVPRVVILGAGSGTISTSVEQPVNFSADSPGRGLVYTWDFGDGSPFGMGANVSHTYTQAGSESNNFFITNPVTVTVRDVLGRTSSTSINVKVLPPPPTASFTYNQPYYGYYNVTFDASGSTIGTQNATYSWNFGDNVGMDTQNNPMDSYTYQTSGTYTVTLTITDDQNQTSQPFTMDITVQ